ncbi:MAG: GNAT family acetyltransferase [Chloroflexi bacterium]|nr:GNAT family acetyltransferase [Chloroflexota bacterium]MBU1747606.1 GNAT family acetyltransferase [Chloroflexota bacterium]
MRIREFTMDDYDAVLGLWRTAGPGVHLRTSDSRTEIAKKQERDPDLFLLADEDGQLVGAVLGGWDGRRGLVYHLAVAPAHRARGIGQALMEELEHRLRAKGCLRYYMLVARDNADALTFYEHLGYERMDDIVPLARSLTDHWGSLE